MTKILTLALSRRRRDDVASPRIQTMAVRRSSAEKACEPLFARIAPAGPLDADERRAFIDAIVEIVPVGNDRQVPVRSWPSLHLHVLIDGWAYRAHTLPDGARQITDVLLPGDFCGLAPSMSHDSFQDVRACGCAWVAVLRKDIVAARGPAMFARSLQWAREAEARILRSRLVSLGRQDARARVAYFISEMHDRLRRVGLTEGGAFTCPLTQEQLGDALGLTPVHVNRVLQRMRAEGLVVINRPNVSIPDLARLHTVADFMRNPRDE